MGEDVLYLVGDYFYNYPKYFDLPFLEAINFRKNYGTLRVGSIAEKESILYYSKDYASYNYYFTLSKVNEKYKLFVFRIKDSVKGDEDSKASYLMHHSKGVLR